MEERRALLGSPRLSLLEKLGYGLGHIHNDLAAAIWFSYSLIFYQLVAQAGPLLSGVLIFVGQGVDAVATPIAGYIVDHSSYSRRTWHILGSIVVSLSFPMMFTLCSICGARTGYQAAYYAAFISLFQCGWALVQISHLSILPEMASTDRDRAELTAYRYSATMVANIAVYIIAFGFFYNLKNNTQNLIGPADTPTFQEIAVTVNTVGIVATLVFQLLGKRRSEAWEAAETRNEERGDGRKGNRGEPGLKWWDVVIIAGLYTTSRLFLTLTMEYLPLYIDLNVQASGQALATVPLALFLASAFTSFSYRRFDSCLGQRWTYIIGSAACLAGCLIVYFNAEASVSTKNVFIAAALFGAGSALTMVVSLSLAANLIGTRVEHGAFVYSTVTFADKLINGITVVLIQYIGCSEDESCPNFYRDVLACLNGGTVLLGCLFFLGLSSKLISVED